MHIECNRIHPCLRQFIQVLEPVLCHQMEVLGILTKGWGSSNFLTSVVCHLGWASDTWRLKDRMPAPALIRHSKLRLRTLGAPGRICKPRAYLRTGRMSPTYTYGEPVIQPAPALHSATIILLHGLGASGVPPCQHISAVHTRHIII